jgi:serine/threonine-protein kinase
MVASGGPDWTTQQIGRVLGKRWTLERALGAGGTAVVFEATHRNGKRVAVKILRPERSLDARMRRRFVREGYAANRVGHPAVVGVDDDGEEPDGTVYLVMELLAGESLDRLAQRLGGSVPWRLTVEMTIELLDVLATAHRRGITHRDIKPANLWWSDAGALRVLDFGLARFAEAPALDHVSTVDGVLLGTPAFMAPEQARAAVAAVGPLSDIWAVGATAFSLLTGRRVYEAPTLEEQLALAAACPAPALSKYARGVPASVTSVFQRSLAYDPDARWPDADAMRDALAAALRELEPDARAAETTSQEATLLATLPERSPKARSRALHPIVLPGVALGVALALGGAALAAKRRGMPRPPAPATAVQQPHVELQAPPAGTASSLSSGTAPAGARAGSFPTVAAPSPALPHTKRSPEPAATPATSARTRPNARPAASGLSGMIEEPPF